MKNALRILPAIFLFLFTLVLFTAKAQAVNMDSNQYHIQFGNVNIGGQNMSNPAEGTNLTSSIGQTAAGEFRSNGYIVKAGFQYIHSVIPFTFQLSNIRADLGTLMPNTPATAAINMTVSYGGAGQYIVTAAETGPFRNFDNAPIANTSCDGGANTCSTTLAKPWTSLAAYGFGYSMTGEDVPADFIDNTYYRPFADKNAAEQPAIVMQSANVTENITPTPNPSLTPAPLLTGTPRDITHQATMTFRVNISPLQSTGSYNTVIHFVATPSF